MLYLFIYNVTLFRPQKKSYIVNQLGPMYQRLYIKVHKINLNSFKQGQKMNVFLFFITTQLTKIYVITDYYLKFGTY
jgi:hypothetical protein